MSLIRKSLGMLCKITGHKWRRLRKAECVTDQGTPLATADVLHLRICARCLTVRQIKARKAKT